MTCPTCNKREKYISVLSQLDMEVVGLLKANATFTLDSCIVCVVKHISRAMGYYEELITAQGAGRSDGSARIHPVKAYIAVCKHLGLAIEESAEFTDLHAELLKVERAFRYAAVPPDWDTLYSLIEKYADALPITANN